MTDADSRDGEGRPRDRSFDAPWQARAFALAVALTDRSDRDWAAFQSRLVDEIEASSAVDPDDPDETYYRQWLAGLERLLVEEDLVEPGALRDRVDEFAAGDRSAHEFVDGDPHAHADDLPEGHATGSAHDHDGHGDPHAHGDRDANGEQHVYGENDEEHGH